MSATTIEFGIPMPPAGKPGPEVKFPWAQMRPGDSFFVPGGRLNQRDSRRGTAAIVGTAAGYKIIKGSSWGKRAVTENGVNGVRVWRVS
jgi:hypothetical protein